MPDNSLLEKASEFLFGRKELKKAAAPAPTSRPAGDTSYLQQQIRNTKTIKQDAGMSELSRPNPKKKPVRAAK